MSEEWRKTRRGEDEEEGEDEDDEGGGVQSEPEAVNVRYSGQNEDTAAEKYILLSFVK